MSKADDKDASFARRYRNVRALSRGLRLLTELNSHGQSTPRELAEICKIDRTTVYRLLETLMAEGFVTQAEEGKVGLTIAVRQLSEGFTDIDWISSKVAPELEQLVLDIDWATDFATYHHGTMIIRESTHRLSPYTPFRAMVGKERPLLLSALGRAVFAFSSERKRNKMLNQIIKFRQTDMHQAQDADYVAHLAETTLEQGYASSTGLVDSDTSAIALPVQRSGKVIGSINIIFFRRVFTPQQAADRYLGKLRATVERIEQNLARMSPG